MLGGAGDDLMIGGAGKDHFVYFENAGNDVIREFELDKDVINLRLLPEAIRYSKLTIVDMEDGCGVKITHEALDGSVEIRGIAASDLSASNFRMPDGETTKITIGGAWFTQPTDCQRRLKIRPKGGAKDCHLGWWADLGVRLGFGDAVRGFFRRERAAEPCRAQAVRARRPPAGRHGLSGWGRSRHPGLRGALPAGAGRRRAAVQLSALFLRARLWLRR